MTRPGVARRAFAGQPLTRKGHFTVRNIPDVERIKAWIKDCRACRACRAVVVMTVHDLAELELAYALPYGSAKDPVNLAGMAAQNVLDGDVSLAQWSEVATLDPAKTFLLDVRRADDRAKGFIPGSIHIPLDELRGRLGELPRDREIIVSCHTGQRSYFACRVLMQNGFHVRNLTGSWRTWSTATQRG